MIDTPPAGACPIWCDIADHTTVDGRNGYRITYEMFCLARHCDDDADCESLIVGLDLDAGDDEPHISIVPRFEDAECETQLTLDEAERVAEHLTVLVRKGRAAIERDQSVTLLIRALADTSNALREHGLLATAAESTP